MNRNRMVGGALALVVGAGAIGWVAGSQISSPAEAAANAQPPTPSLITVAVDQRLLSADIAARGNIDYDDPVGLKLSGAIGEDGAPQVVTMVPEVGTELAEGGVALEVVGRPVILLQGDLPVYRDLRPGSRGDDVFQLEEALVRLGLMSSADEVWDNNTGAAVQALYARAGYVANSASKSDQAELKAAREGVRMANQGVQDAIKALNEAGGAQGSALLEAQNAVTDAEAALVQARATRTQAVTAAQGELTLANTAVTTAQARYNKANNDNEHPDHGMPPTAGELLDLQDAVTAAQVAQTNAQNALATVQGEQDAAVKAAERAVQVAKVRLNEAKSPGDRTSLQRAVEDARRNLSDATQALADIESTVGTWLPAGELIYVKNLPVRVSAVSVERGTIVQSDFMTVTGSNIAMTIGISESDSKRVEVGSKVLLNDPNFFETPLEAEIASMSQPSGSGRVTLTVLLEEIPQELMGMTVRVVIPIESTSGEVLVVPAAALSAVADGSTRVEVELADKPGETRYVTVRTGLAADGVVEVTPIDGELAKGDRVVVGKADLSGIVDEDEDTDGDSGSGSDEESLIEPR